MTVVKRTIIFLILFAAAASAFAANFGSDEQTMRMLDRELAIATYTADINWFRLHLADDYVLITASGATTTKAQLIEQLKASSFKMELYEPTEVAVRAYGSTVIVSGRMLQKYTSSGERVTADLRYSNVWIKTEDGWFNISGQLSPVSIKTEKIKASGH